MGTDVMQAVLFLGPNDEPPISGDGVLLATQYQNDGVLTMFCGSFAVTPSEEFDAAAARSVRWHPPSSFAVHSCTVRSGACPTPIGQPIIAIPMRSALLEEIRYRIAGKRAPEHGDTVPQEFSDALTELERVQRDLIDHRVHTDGTARLAHQHHLEIIEAVLQIAKGTVARIEQGAGLREVSAYVLSIEGLLRGFLILARGDAKIVPR